jgi:hypothetical protein
MRIKACSPSSEATVPHAPVIASCGSPMPTTGDRQSYRAAAAISRLPPHGHGKYVSARSRSDNSWPPQFPRSSSHQSRAGQDCATQLVRQPVHRGIDGFADLSWTARRLSGVLMSRNWSASSKLSASWASNSVDVGARRPWATKIVLRRIDANSIQPGIKRTVAHETTAAPDKP